MIWLMSGFGAPSSLTDEGLPDKVRLAIHRLREKLGASADAIKTVRGVGIVYDD